MYSGIFFLSAATLLLEITLTRIFAVTQGHHFAFMAVSLALLGFGASGTALAIFPRVLKWAVGTTLAGASSGFAVAATGGLLITNALPFDAYSLIWDTSQLLYLGVYYLVLAVPFFFTGAAVGTALAKMPDRAGTLYGANLLGSAAGCLLSVLGPPLFGAPGTVAAASLLGLTATAAFAGKHLRLWLVPVVPGAAVLVGLAWLSPSVLDLRVSPYKSISQALRPSGSERVWSRWNAFSLVEVVDSPSLHIAPGLSFAYDGELPPQMALSVDGDNLSSITDAAPDDAEFTRALPTSLVYSLSKDPEVLVVEPQGGLDVLTALYNGAASVVAVVSNPLVRDVVARDFGPRSGDVYNDTRVEVVVDGHRSYLKGTDERFDVVQVALRDSFRPVLAGAYSISENYVYTSEAFQEYFRRLQPDGFLSVTRWLQVPPSEGVRAVSVAIDALEREGVSEPGMHLAAIRSLQTLTLLVKKGELTQADISGIREFSQRLQYDVVYYPGIQPSELNRFSIHPAPIYHDVVRAMLSAGTREDLYRAKRFDISPVSDNRPFYFHLFKWKQTGEVLGNLGRTFRPFGGAGFLILLGVLIVAAAASIAFIVAPLLLRRRPSDGPERQPPASGAGGWRPFVYFGALGLGFLWIEIPLLQRFILLLDQPTYSFAAVLFAILLWSGVGSTLSRRSARLSSLAAPATGTLALAYALAVPSMIDAALGLPLVLRLGVAVASLAPLGIAMGVPFPNGIRLLGERAPNLVPWAWAVNGSASVLSAILATLLALSFGFTWVMVGAGAAYLVASGAAYPWWRRPQAGGQAVAGEGAGAEPPLRSASRR